MRLRTYAFTTVMPALLGLAVLLVSAGISPERHCC
jgi:hypothetical protein